MNQCFYPIITIDGPSGVGKGTLSQSIAKHYGFHLLDSGAIYRVLALDLIQNQLLEADESMIVARAMQLPVLFKNESDKVDVYLDGNNVSELIRQEEVGTMASKIAAIPKVREALLQRQKDFATAPGLVADGRDMGTVVFPNAPVKLFIDASSEARANRRINQLAQKGVPYDERIVLQDIIDRDLRDRTRAVSPLQPARDALIIDTTDLTIEEVFQQALNYIKTKWV